MLLTTGCALAQNTPTIGVLPDNGPSLPATCVIGQIYFRTATTIGLNQCNPANTWTAFSTASGAGTVNAGTTGQFAFYPASAAAVSGGGPITTNVFPKGDATNAFANSLATDDGTTLTYTGTGGLTLNGTGEQFTSTQGTITTSKPFSTHTGTWNAGGVVFTNWLSNITCTAAAANSIALGLGVAGTTWQFKYGTANCATPTLTVPTGTAAAVSIGPNVNSGLFWSGATTIIANGAAQIMQFTTTGPSIITGDLQTNPNCSANGTAANPSVVSCAAASAGSFSCATNASTGTCQVNTTVVTANSEIFITQRSDTTTGTRLGVTCNTGLTSAIPEVTAVTAATSFTINLGTVVTNPECFSYFIIN